MTGSISKQVGLTIGSIGPGGASTSIAALATESAGGVTGVSYTGASTLLPVVTSSPGGGSVLAAPPVWSSGASMWGGDVPAFATWRGAPVTHVTTWADDTAYHALTSPQFASGGEYENWTGSANFACGGLWAAPTDGAVSTWAAAGGGTSDSFYTSLLTNLKANWTRISRGQLYIRFAHEMNGNWYPWQVQSADAANFVAAFRRFYNIKQTVFPAAKLCFAVNANGMNGFDWSTATWPGDGYVDVYDVDWYSNHWMENGQSTGPYLDGTGAPYGLASHLAFAAAHGKPMGIGEWGLNPTNGDVPNYIQAMRDFFGTNAGSSAGKLSYEALYNIAAYALYPPNNGRPLSAAKYQAIFGTPVNPNKISDSTAVAVAATRPAGSLSLSSVSVARITTASRAAVGTSSAAVSSSFVTRSGYNLMLDGAVWKPTGVNLPWSMGCGAEVAGLVPTSAQHDALFAALPPKSILRYFLFQNYGWGPFDTLLAKARPYGHRFIVALTDANAGCGEPYGGGSGRETFWGGGWSTGGFKDNWLTPTVNRYKNEPLIAWWEWSNEPAQDSTNFQNYLTNVGSYVRGTLGDTHLIGTGAMCSYTNGGSAGTRAINGNAYIDLASSHTYDSNFTWLGQSDYLDANAVGKPIYQGEWSPQLQANDSNTWGATRAATMASMIQTVKSSYPHMVAMTWWSGAGLYRSMDIPVQGCPEMTAIINNPLL